MLNPELLAAAACGGGRAIAAEIDQYQIPGENTAAKENARGILPVIKDDERKASTPQQCREQQLVKLLKGDAREEPPPPPTPIL